MSVDLIDRKTGIVFATCPDIEWALKHMRIWGLAARNVEIKVNK